MIGKSRNAGQVCVSPTRFFVQDAIYDRFTAAFTEKAAALKVGNGLDPANDMGPLANDRRITAMETLVADARAKGARVTTGGTRIGNRGYYFPLTVVADVPDDARAMREEPFGPLALLSRRDASAETAQCGWPMQDSCCSVSDRDACTCSLQHSASPQLYTSWQDPRWPDHVTVERITSRAVEEQ